MAGSIVAAGTAPACGRTAADGLPQCLAEQETAECRPGRETTDSGSEYDDGGRLYAGDAAAHLYR